ncbi:MAG: radical SAM protein [Candidatus Gastranaerophilales bacterium]|nr:radical SAM protein [Candidatus Gastranaerophilales bacterium]
MENQLAELIVPPVVEMKELKNLFLQLSSKACNLKCKNCYIERNPLKNEEDFIPIEKIKENLSILKGRRINSLYLTGGEPLLHPDFNQILRMCLKITNTTVMSNGTMINDKKARFLRKIDDESQFETIYRISLDSTNELENDEMRGRGSYRKALGAIMSLIKYEFNPIISVVNYKNLKKEEIFDDFRNFFRKKGIEIDEINLKIIPYFPKNIEMEEIKNFKKEMLDCATSRVISKNGIYACPMLANDYRARLGSSLADYSKVNYLDCEKCSVCTKLGQRVQVNDWI